MELKSGAWAKTYSGFADEVLKNTKMLKLDPKLIDAIEDNKPALAKLKDVDKLIKTFVMARGAQKGPFLEPYKKAVSNVEQAHAKYLKTLVKAAKDFGPKDKQQLKLFERAWKPFIKNLEEMSAQPESQVKGMEQEIEVAGTLDKKAENARKDAQKNAKKLHLPFAVFKKTHERAMETDIANENKHAQAMRKAETEYNLAKNKYAAKRQKMEDAAKAAGEKLKEKDVVKKLGEAPPETFEAEPFEPVFNKNYVEDFNDELDAIVDTTCDPLLGLAKAMKKKGLDMGKEFPAALVKMAEFPAKNRLQLSAGRGGVYDILQEGLTCYSKLGPAIAKMPKKK